MPVSPAQSSQGQPAGSGELPTIAITMGDPAGIGPEIIARAWQQPRLHEICRPIVVGLPHVLRLAAEVAKVNVNVEEACLRTATPSPRSIPCVVAGDEQLSFELALSGQIHPSTGKAACDAVSRATELALSGSVDGIATCPLNKAAIAAAGSPFPGHTEMLADLCGVEDSAMMLYLPADVTNSPHGLGVVHVTLHQSLQSIFSDVNTGRILSRIELIGQLFSRLKHQGPTKIGVCALNPHAGEEGLFGDEERDQIEPAVQAAKASGYDVSGPIPADTLFVRAAAGEFDAVVAMYHDQGHIALKLLGMHDAVNITLGLPIVRTSVAHGTAFDKAGKGTANPHSLLQAISVAAQLATKRKTAQQ